MYDPETTEIYQPLHRSESDVLREKSARLKELNNGEEVTIKGLTARDIGQESRAWRVIFNTRDEKTQGVCFFTDWDDTLEAYTSRKTNLYNNLLDQIVSSDNRIKNQAKSTFEAINRAARILPHGQHPERYEPLLELFAESFVINYLNNRQTQIPAFDILLENPTEAAARNFIREIILPKLEGKISATIEDEKTYFTEQQHQATSLDFLQKPPLVDQKVWDLFVENMTASNITQTEIDHFDLPPNIYWIVVTFGDLSYQTSKVLNGLNTLKQNNKRMPDEILVLTRGRKPPIIKRMLSEFVNIPCLYLDDSPRQLSEIPGLIPIRAVRTESKRAQDPIARKMITVNMETNTLSQIVSEGLRQSSQ